MKVECPVCGQVGILEQRGNSARVVHYRYVDGTRIFTKHTLKNGNRVGTMGTALGTEKPNTSFFNQNKGARGLARIRTLACGAGGPGFKSPRARQIGTAGSDAYLFWAI